MFSTLFNRVALISVDGDPAAAIGQEEASGQNVYVRQVGQALARQGWQVDMFTRRTSSTQPAIAQHSKNCRTIYLTVGPQTFMSQDCLFNYLPEFIQELQAFQRQEGIQYALVHTNYEPFSLVAIEAMASRTPVVASKVGGLQAQISRPTTTSSLSAGIQARDMAVATELRTLGSKGVWGRCPQPDVPPLNPVLTNMAMAIAGATHAGWSLVV